jgi:iron complex transport system ATP-binding protein
MKHTHESIRAQGVCVQIGAASLLRSIDLEIPSGAVTVLMGPNGAGKTTLLRVLGGLDAPSAGEISWGADALVDLEVLERARRVSHVGHEAAPPFPWTAFELVLMGRAPHLGLQALEQEEDHARAREALRAVELDGFESRTIDSLSAGEAQRLMWARALCQDTPVLMLDEPVSHQDPRHALNLMELLRSLARKGRTILVVLHDVSLAMRYADHVVLLRDGELLASGPTEATVTTDVLSQVYGAPCRREGDTVIFDPSVQPHDIG